MTFKTQSKIYFSVGIIRHSCFHSYLYKGNFHLKHIGKPHSSHIISSETQKLNISYLGGRHNTGSSSISSCYRKLWQWQMAKQHRQRRSCQKLNSYRNSSNNSYCSRHNLHMRHPCLCSVCYTGSRNSKNPSNNCSAFCIWLLPFASL